MLPTAVRVSQASPLSPDYFVRRHVRADANFSTTNADLYAAYAQLASTCGLPAASHRKLTQAMHRAGLCQSANRQNGRTWPGVAVVDLTLGRGSRPRTTPVPGPKGEEYPPAEFITEHVTYDERYETTNAELFAVYCATADESGREPCSHRRLSMAVIEAGFRQSASRKHGRVWPCLYLKNVPVSE